MKISACMIAKNEELNIETSLGSLCGQVDEIIVVDTGSTDHTIELAKQWGPGFLIFHGGMISRRREILH